MLSGCRISAEPTAAPLRPAYVDIAALVRRHPLHPERQRLGERPVSVSLEPLPEVWEARLPSLPSDGGVELSELSLDGAMERARREVRERRRRQRLRLLAQRRAELIAAERGALALRERELKEGAERRQRLAAASLATTLGELRTAEQLYRSQLRDGVPGQADNREQAGEIERLRPLAQPIPIGVPELKASVERLKGPAGFRPAPRSRMVVMAEAAGGARRRLGQELVARREEGRRQGEAEVARAQAEAAARVEARLAALTGTERGDDLEKRVQSVASAALARAAEMEMGAQKISGTSERRWRTRWASASKLPTTTDRAALLEALIEQDVVARVRDAAQRQRLALTTTTVGGVPDRTAQVGGWIGLR
jgi:hypothetical protein